MGKNINHIQHVKSNVVLEGKPKLPQSGVLVEGELAVNYSDGYETISLENTNNEIVTFSSDEYYTKQKLGSGFTGENSAKTVTDVIVENEEIISASLNDINERKLDASAFTVHTADTTIHLTSGDIQTQIDDSNLWVSGSGTNAVVLKNSSGIASGVYAVAEGYNTSATSISSHAEGFGTLASSYQSHAEGGSTSATSYQSHAEGSRTLASGSQSHAEGYETSATSTSSHAEGSSTIASGAQSHAEGSSAIASGISSHAEGFVTKANGDYSHVEGRSTIAENDSEHASGQYNVSSSASTTFGNSGNTLFSVGNGTADNARHNAFEIRQNGDIYIVSGGTTIKLQDEIGNITIDQVIDSGTSASTDAVSTSAVYGFVTSYTPSITVDQVLDDTTSASTNPVSSKAVYDAVTDNELVWTNAYVTLSGAVSSITEDLSTNYYTKDETSGKTEISTALGTKVNSGTYTGHTADTSVHFSGNEKEHLDSLATNIAAISGITSEKVTSWDTAATSAHNHTNKTYLDGITGTVGTMVYQNTSSYSSATEVNTALGDKADKVSAFTDAEYNSTDKKIYFKNSNGTVVDNIDTTDFIKDGMVNNVEVKTVAGSGTCLVISFNTDAGKEDINIPISDIFNASNYYQKSETSGATELSTAFNGKTDTATTTALNNVVTAHTANTNIHLTTTEKGQLHTHTNKTYLDGITGTVGTMAYENASSYSSATQVNTALGDKADNSSFTAHTASTVHMSTTEKTNLDSLATNIATISGISSSNVSNWNGKVDNSAFTAHTASTVHMTTTEKTNLDSLATNIAAISGITSAKVTSWDNAVSDITDLSGQSETVAAALNELNTNKLDASALTEVNSAISDLEDIVGSGYTNTTITAVIENMDQAVAAALTDLNDKIGDIESILATI